MSSNTILIGVVDALADLSLPQHVFALVVKSIARVIVAEQPAGGLSTMDKSAEPAPAGNGVTLDDLIAPAIEYLKRELRPGRFIRFNRMIEVGFDPRILALAGRQIGAKCIDRGDAKGLYLEAATDAPAEPAKERKKPGPMPGGRARRESALKGHAKRKRMAANGARTWARGGAARRGSGTGSRWRKDAALKAAATKRAQKATAGNNETKPATVPGHPDVTRSARNPDGGPQDTTARAGNYGASWRVSRSELLSDERTQAPGGNPQH